MKKIMLVALISAMPALASAEMKMQNSNPSPTVAPEHVMQNTNPLILPRFHGHPAKRLF